MERQFVKMHGLGNDFVVFDGRKNSIALNPQQAAAIADRRLGVGCDQLLIIENDTKADIKMVIFNSDGSTATACGNGSRCVADLIMTEQKTDKITINTKGGIIEAVRAPNDMIAVDMGLVRLDWGDIPLRHETDTLAIDLEYGDLPPAIGVNVGNPHAVHIVDDAEKIDLAGIGRQLENHPIFPERANIEFISLIAKDTIRVRVWERGSGITRACGTGACAAAVAACRGNITGREVLAQLDGGVLKILWNDDNHVIMTGPAALSFEGRLDIENLR